MYLIKILILFAIFVLCSFIGKIIAGKFKSRLEELKELKNSLNIFKTKIKFTYSPIPEIFDEIGKNSSKNVGKIFTSAKEKMKNKTAGEAWKESIESTNSNLNDDDKKTLQMLSKMLGEADLDGQVGQIDITLNFLEKQIQNAEEEKNKNAKLYSKLGTIIGLAIVIMLF
ncbi:MAG: stage III sporulation protein AB [Clostridia bacterium]|nr:stage III sporulation protein AB [Clostridia bacterium]